ncbi:PR/SET domain 13 isoform X2 [Rhodnius prolixus]
MRLSDDIHSCNTILDKGTKENCLILQITKPVAKGEQLVLWFSQEILAAMDIPFLNPINIKGEKSYNCHRCCKTFEYPNPLKIHLALDCGKEKPTNLWKRLQESIFIDNGNSNHLHPHEFILQLSLKNNVSQELIKPENVLPPSPGFTSYSSPSPDRLDPSSEDNRPSSEPPRHSAFKPYLNSPCRGNSSEHNIHIPSIMEYQQVPLINRIEQSREIYLSQQAAEIETLVSNMGQSKQGHLCLYCGKIYSRKYGLKIHIRTHTGFKPLKCKYCLRPFGDPSNLNKHVRLHADGDTPYRCDLCGKMLVRRRDLERHMKSRHNINFV